jgi:hypothetical protein
MLSQELEEGLKTGEVGLHDGRSKEKGVDPREDDGKVRGVWERGEEPILVGEPGEATPTVVLVFRVIRLAALPRTTGKNPTSFSAKNLIQTLQ